MHYSGAVYRPPSEARSLIVQCTLGCSHNKCAFCTMYKDKKFSINPIEQVLSDLGKAEALEAARVKLAEADAAWAEAQTEAKTAQAALDAAMASQPEIQSRRQDITRLEDALRRYEQLDTLRAWAKDPKVVAIGEIGLDYYWEQNPPRELQQRVLRDQLALAQELDLPVIVHDREAHADSLAIVQEFPAVRGVFHCFSGSVEMARELLKRGWYLGFDGPVTYKNARKTVEVALECPLDRMLLETDSPYMAPVPVRGTRNDSRSVRYIAEKLAALRGLDTDELIRLTAENGKRLFGIG